MKVSVVIRTFNEGNWLSLALESLIKQIGIVINTVYIVDSGSTDCTLSISAAYGKFLNIETIQYSGDYLPGNSLNQGIVEALKSETDFVCILSAHCIIQEANALLLMSQAITPEIRAVFGKQCPLEFSDGIAWRDMAHLYPSESRIYAKHPVLNNAFSLYSKVAFDDHLFDENVTNLEDVLWAHIELTKGYKIQYLANVSVAHYHGPNHQNSPARLLTTLNVIKSNVEVFKLRSSKLGIRYTNFVNIIFLTKPQDLECLIKVVDGIQTVVSCPKNLVKSINNLYPDYKIIERDFHPDKSLHIVHSEIKEKILELYPRVTYIISYDSTYDANYIVLNIEDIIDTVENTFPDIVFQVAKDNSLRINNLSGSYIPSDEKSISYKVLRGNGTVYRLNKLGQSDSTHYESIELENI